MWRVVIALLAGCYSPSSDPRCAIECVQASASPCPAGLVCGTASLCESPTGPSCNSILDAQPPDGDESDGMVDGSTIACDNTAFAPPVMVVSGFSHYTPSRDRMHFSVYAPAGPDVRINDGVPDSGNQSDYLLGPTVPSAISELGSGRIDPSALRVYMTGPSASDSGDAVFYVSRRISPVTAWSVPDSVTLNVNAVPTTKPAGALIGAMAEGDVRPLRIPITEGTGFGEYVAMTDTQLHRQSLVTPADLGVLMIASPSFSPDGLRVVFIGQAEVGKSAIMMSSRATLSSPWTNAIILRYDVVETYNEPYITNDCSYLYWLRSSTQVMRAAHL